MDDHLIPMFREKYPDIRIQATYDSSGKLQSQIEEGASIDVFMSAAMKQMTELEEKGLVAGDSIMHLLENKIVLIVPVTSSKGMISFEDIINADRIAIGDPARRTSRTICKGSADQPWIMGQGVCKCEPGYECH